MVKRTIVHIDERKCTGCGKCVSPCAEGAIKIVNGKAVVTKELCDGAGFCLGICPTGALSLEVKDAPKFNEREAMKGRAKKRAYIPQKCYLCGESEDHVNLFPTKAKGESLWVCAKCIPGLIHG
jgi:Fe-S-cluster-containing hydrogenase component 2